MKNRISTLVLTFIALFVVIFASPVMAQEVPTTPVSLGIGQVDYQGQHDAIAGWVIQTVRPTASTLVRVYRGTGGAPVWQEPTQWSRPDINAWKGEGINAFHFRIPVALCLGVPVSVRVVGVTDEGQEFSLTNGDFSLTCATPPAIEGVVKNEFLMPVTTEGLGAYMTLYRIAETGEAVWMSTTDCARAIGCVNATGAYSFKPADLGYRFEEGWYELEVSSQYHHVDRRRVYYSSEYGAYTHHSLRLQELLVGVNADTNFDPQGPEKAVLTVCNRTYGRDWSGLSVVVQGPTKNASWGSREDKFYIFGIPTGNLGCQDFDLEVPMASDLPNGRWYHFTVKLVNYTRWDEVYGEVSWASAKGVTPMAYPLGDAAMRAEKPTGIPWHLLGISR